MRKSTGLLKRLVALSLVLLLSIESFAAVVGDNDGAAFITKAEFDSLKSTFQEQINRYNQSIDNKIDGAIASYLDGIKVGNKDVCALSTSILSYPITIYNDEYTYTIEKWNAQTRSARWWIPSVNTDYYFVEHIGNGDAYHTRLDQYRCYLNSININKIKNFYNLTNLDIVSNKAEVVGINYDYNVTQTSNGIIYLPEKDFYANGWKYGVVTRRDQSDYTYASNAFTINFTNIIGDGAKTYSSTTKYNHPTFAYYANNAGTPVISEDYTKLTDTTSTWWRWDAPSTDDTVALQNDVMSSSYNFNGELNTLWTGYNKDLHVPVTFDNVLYWTNKSDLKYDLLKFSETTSSANVFWKGKKWTTAGQETVYYANIDNGETLEMEGAKLINTRPWYRCALVYGSHLYYTVKLPSKKVDKKVGLFDGVLITDLPAGKTIALTEIDLNVEFGDNAIRYLMVSNNPIPKCTISEPTVSDGVLPIYGDEQASGSSYTLYPLQDGLNKVYLNSLESGDDIYIKVVWDNTNTSYTKILEEPKVKITYS